MSTSLKSALKTWAMIVALWAPVYFVLVEASASNRCRDPTSSNGPWSPLASSGLGSILVAAWKDTRDPAWRAAHKLPPLHAAAHRRPVARTRESRAPGRGMMEILRGALADFHPQFWASVVEIIWINVLLSGDNALVIALACRALPRASGHRHGARRGGRGHAALAFASIVSKLMVIPYLKIAGGVALLWIAAKLLVTDDQRRRDGDVAVAQPARRRQGDRGRRRRHEPRQRDRCRRGRGRQLRTDRFRPRHEHPADRRRRHRHHGRAQPMSPPLPGPARRCSDGSRAT